MNPNHNTRQKEQGGFSLVEVLVSAAVLGIAVAGVMAMLQKGTELDVNGDHRRQARAIIHAAFERPEFHFSRYKTLDPSTWTENRLLDSASANPITAVLTCAVSAERSQNMAGSIVPYKEISMALQWQEVEGTDSVRIIKWLAEPR